MREHPTICVSFGLKKRPKKTHCTENIKQGECYLQINFDLKKF